MTDVRTNVPQFRNKPTVAYNADDMTWQTDAACRDHDPETFFPDNSGKQESTAAIAICNTCPLTAHQGCARLALDLHSQYGVWAGIYLGTNPASRSRARQLLHLIANTTTEVAS